MLSFAIVIPFYNHGQFAERLIASLQPYGLPLIIVDDGSDKNHQALLQKAIAGHRNVYMQTNEINAGKGAAVIKGFKAAKELKFTHVLQVDADCQHDFQQIPRFIEAATANPSALISGYPEYDDSVPKSRLYPRYITHFWVWVNTLSFSIKDSMCGFRCYPLAKTWLIIDQYRIGQRMDFDIEIIVRMQWAKVLIINLPVKVIYHVDASSHFRVWQDNVLISKTHAKLFFAMLLDKVKALSPF